MTEREHDNGKSGSCCSSCSHDKVHSLKILDKYKDTVILFVSLLSLVLSFVLAERLHDSFMRYLDIGWIAVILCGTPIFVSAAKSLGQKKITSALLISVSILACILLEALTLSKILGSDGHGHGYIFAAGEVAFLMKLGGKIEDFTVSRARSGVSNLVALSPTTAKYKTDNGIIEKPLTEVKIGDIVIVLPGDVISVDGIIIAGQTAVDESVMTGEAVPVDKKVGDKVFGGTQNTVGALEIRVTKTSDEMTVTKLKKLVEEAEGKKAPISRLADRWAGYIVPSAVAISIIVFFLTLFVFTKRDMSEAVLRGVTMLVVFCPCALSLATPTAIAAALGAGARHGVLIKSGGAIEQLAGISTFAFDKTGTLTTGSISVVDIISYQGDKRRLAAIAGACESMSEHPIAKAITSYCKKLCDLPKVSDTKALIGTGVEAVVEGRKITVCKWDFLEGKNIDFSVANADAKSFLNKGKTVVAVLDEGVLAGIIILSDTIRDGSAAAIRKLKKIGIRAVMLTGDNKFVAAEIAKDLGIECFFAGLLPIEKLDKVKELQQSGKVCMVGDGVNDAPALAGADCSIAMGALGSDAAIETADIALMTNDIENVASVAVYSKKVLLTIKINIIMSLGINVLALILNLCGLLNPVTGALIHNVSSVLVVINSAFLLKRWRKFQEWTK